jgi:crotonobetainyl-CoA:carnitine CoA-transferase CaiB-like acyl-CoA transferase
VVIGAPKRGEHTRQVLHELAGMDDAEINALAATGAFGDVEV